MDLGLKKQLTFCLKKIMLLSYSYEVHHGGTHKAFCLLKEDESNLFEQYFDRLKTLTWCIEAGYNVVDCEAEFLDKEKIELSERAKKMIHDEDLHEAIMNKIRDVQIESFFESIISDDPPEKEDVIKFLEDWNDRKQELLRDFDIEDILEEKYDLLDLLYKVTLSSCG